MTEEEKPIPSGRPRPGMEPQKKEEEKPQQERKLHPGRGDMERQLPPSIAGRIATDVRFWIFISGVLVGILIGITVA